MTSKELFELRTADKLSRLMNYLDKLQKDLNTNNSRRDEEIASSLFTMRSIVHKMTRACHNNDIDTEMKIAVRLNEFYQTVVKEMI